MSRAHAKSSRTSSGRGRKPGDGRPARSTDRGKTRASVPRLNTEQVADAIVEFTQDDHSLNFITHDVARALWAAILDLMSDSLLDGKSVVMRNVGTLETYMKASQRYRHPATGVIRIAAPKRHIRLVLSPRMREKLRKRP